MSLLQDLRFALRLLVKDRWFSVVAITALALGIGVNATVFTLVNAVLIRGLPFPEADRLYVLGVKRPTSDRRRRADLAARPARLARRHDVVRRPGRLRARRR